MTTIIETDGLSRWYGHVIGLNEVTVSIGPGVTGLLGPNGAGKTTFLNLVTGQIRPSQGTIQVMGERPWGNVSLKSRIGYCPEPDAFYRFMSGHEFVYRLARLHGFGRREASDRAERALYDVEMADAMYRPIGGYSKGMRQRTKLAQAMVHDPDLLILDEPLVGTDPIGRRLMIDKVRELGRRGKHVLVSSHVLHEVEAMTDTMLLIRRGRLRASGHIGEVRSQLHDHPHTVKMRAADGRRLAQVLLQREEVRSVELLDEHRILSRVSTPQTFFESLPGLLQEADLIVEELKIEDAGLDAVFQYLIQGRKA